MNLREQMQELEARRFQDPEAALRLIEIYKDLLTRIAPDKHPEEHATLQASIGEVSLGLQIGDRAATLQQAMTSFQAALEIWTLEKQPLKHAQALADLGYVYRDMAQDLPNENANEHWIKAIACYEDVLQVWTLQTNPAMYALTQSDLGDAYKHLSTEGNQSDNLAQAITHYQEALKVWTPQSNLKRYALTKASLGDIYDQFSTQAPLQEAVNCYQEALRGLTLENDPQNYARIQGNLGSIWKMVSSASPIAEANKLRAYAIACYQEALRVWTLQSNPQQYAIVQYEMGVLYYELAYRDLPTNQDANFRQAIASLQEMSRLWTLETNPQTYADAQYKMGDAYHALLTGDRGENLERAISCYQAALQVWTPETNPDMHAHVQADLGLNYSELPTGIPQENLKKAITCYTEALRFLTPQSHPLGYANIQNSLGIAYRDLSDQEVAEDHSTRAIAHFEEALRFYTPENEPLNYARTQLNLGYLYFKRATGNRVENLTKAIHYYQEALRFNTAESAPLSYGHTLTNLGAVYNELPTGDKASNLQQAIKCFNEALLFCTPDIAPIDYARAHMNLGNAYRDLPTGNKNKNLTQAANHYQEALRFWTPQNAPLDYALTQINLGNAYFLIRFDKPEENLAKAITCYQEALRFWSPQISSLNYAGVQSNLGNIYMKLSTGDRTENLLNAISHYQEALSFLKPDSVPLDYAGTQNNLGLAFHALSGQDNLTKAIDCFEEVIRICTIEVAPNQYLGAHQNLAALYFSEQNWQAALKAYLKAIEAVELLYRIGLSTESKAAEVASTIDLYRQAAFTAVRCNDPNQALLILEQGKTRQLTEALHIHISRPIGVPDDTWQQFEHAGEAIRAIQAEDIDQEQHDRVRAYEIRQQRAQAAHATLDQAIEQVRSYAPSFLRALDLPAIQTLIPDEQTALITFCVMDQGIMGFVMEKQSEQMVQVVEVTQFNKENLHHLFSGKDTTEEYSGWFGNYYRYRYEHTEENAEAWQEAITSTLLILGQSLLTPILSILPPTIKRITFLPAAQLFLLPLHAVPLLNDPQTLLCDRYEVSYAPSSEVLLTLADKAKRDVIPALYAVVNPTEDTKLVFTPIEVAGIAQHFTHTTIDEGRANGTIQHVRDSVPGNTYVHFSCHGTYDYTNPLESGLLLSDGLLTLGALQRGEVDFSTSRLVTLSACETGIIDIIQGNAEEYVGLPAGFMLAGVPCVISSLWSVADISTAMLMERFYHNHMQAKMDFAASLREAQVWLRKITVGEVVQYFEQRIQLSSQQKNKLLAKLLDSFRYRAKQNPTECPFKHPYYWAAFTINGL